MDKMNKIVHQIWVGAVLPERERGWVAGVRAAALAAGWEHRLWDWDALMAEFGEEPVARVFRRGFELPGEVISPVVVASLAVDYYRSKVLAVYGGVYLDCDFECRGEWPNFEELLAEQDAEVLGFHEFFKPAMCAGLFAVSSLRPMCIAAELAAGYLLRMLPPEAGDFASRMVELARRDGGRGGLVSRGVGPGWRRQWVLPRWQRAGIRWAMAPRTAVGHVQWDGGAGSALVHVGAAHWHELQGEELSRLWQGRALAAKAFDRRAAAEVMARRRAEWQASLPPGARPEGCAVLPRRRERCMVVPLAPPGREFGWRAPVQLPSGARRIVVLSNVTVGFSVEDAGLRAGDVVMHLNHARHAEAAMQVDGVWHMLFVRHGGHVQGGYRWFHDGGFDGYCKVVFVDSPTMMTPFEWYREWRRGGGKSPTTGFVVANMCRELWPEMPLLLAGFDPGVDMRTPLWGGHSWALEARWYAARGFRLLRPRCAARVLVLVCSCHEFVDRSPHFRDAAGQYTQRRAVRSTWMRRLPPGMQAVFFVGDVPGRRMSEPKVVQLPCPDDYEHLPRKSREVFRWALENQVFDWVFKCDDDTFVHPERLAALVAGGLDARCLYGGREPKGRNRPSGGAGYLLHRSMLERVVADPAWPDCGAEDVEVARAVRRAGGGIVLDARFNSCPSPAPAVDNELVTAHWLRPSEMRRIYKQCFEL